jgi:tellurite resistance protein
MPPPLLIDHALAQELVGGLLTVCRADGDVDHTSFAAMRQIAGELLPGLSVDDEAILLDQHVTPRSLAEAVSHGVSPFRSSGRSEPDEIARMFLRVALRAARADGELSEAEARSILAFADALGISDFKLLDGSLDDWAQRIEN